MQIESTPSRGERIADAPLAPGQYLGSPLAQHRGLEFSLTESAYSPNARLPEHSHACAHFCLVVSGRYTERLEDRQRLRQAGDLVFYPPQSRHAEVHHQRGRHLMIEIDTPLLERAGRLSEFPLSPTVCSRQAGWAATRLMEELRRPSAATPLVLEGLTLELLGRTVAQSAGAGAGQSPEWLDTALLRARTAMPEAPSLACLARSAGVHPVHFSRTMRRCRGESYSEMVKRLRLGIARDLLLETDLPLSEIALEAGYCDQSHLTRSFRDLTGTTPAVFRRLHR